MDALLAQCSGGPQRTTSTGQAARWITLWARLPSRSPVSSPRPRDPRTISPAPKVSAASSTSRAVERYTLCLLYTSDAADEEDSVDLGGRRIIKKKKYAIHNNR